MSIGDEVSLMQFLFDFDLLLSVLNFKYYLSYIINSLNY